MLESTICGYTNPNPTLIALKPRQVMLAEQRRKMTTTNDHTVIKTRTLKPEQKDFLLHSILRYLERSGFSKTLKRFLSEAQIENENWKTCPLELEDIYCTYLETCSHAGANLSTYKEQELQADGMTKIDGDRNCATSEKTISKRKKKKSDYTNSNAVADQSGAAADNIIESAKNSKDEVSEAKRKSKEKKSKKNSDFFYQTQQISSQALPESVDDALCELPKEKSTKKHKKKLISESLDVIVEHNQLDSLPGVIEEKSKKLLSSKCDNKPDSVAKVKSKDKKKKDKSSMISLVENVEQSGLEGKWGLNADQFVAGSALEKNSDIPLKEKEVLYKDSKRKKEGSEDVTNKEKKGSKKRKILDSDGNVCWPVKEVANEESKRRKTEGFEQAKSSKQTIKVSAIPGGDGCVGEESEKENGQVGQNELQETFFKQIDEHANGKLEKDEGEKSATQKNIRKQRNGSTEPNTVNAFQRVKVDKVEFADERLQDNSYWAKDGAEIGYGAKAQEVLGQVRGRDFRHEKTKKKRGSYRGGQIDLQSHSVKFDYSDDD